MWKLQRGATGKELRKVFVETLQSMMDENPNVLALEADLGGASGFTSLKNTHPKQFIQMGIAEANMVGVAAGLSMRGYIPYVHTFAPFSTRRACDQIFLEGAYAQNTLNIYGSDPGVCVGANGGTHNSFEDIAIMRSIPNVLVVAPADEVQLEWTIRKSAELSGVHYIRANRKGNLSVYAPGSEFTFGKGNLLYEGEDVLLLSMGEMLGIALNAADELKKTGISTEVIDMFTLKPFDDDLLRRRIKNKKMVVTFENHSIIGGLGSCVAEVMAEEACGIPLVRIGANDVFGQVGTYDYLRNVFGLTEKNIVNVVKRKLGSALSD